MTVDWCASGHRLRSVRYVEAVTELCNSANRDSVIEHKFF
jgi:hypothetical protein